MTKTNEERENFKLLYDICISNLKKSEDVATYVKGRKFKTSSLRKFQVGAFPRNTKKLREHFNEVFLTKNFILDRLGNSDFSLTNPLVIPIYDEWGRPEAFIGRTIMPEVQREVLKLAKYKNTKFKKSSLLFGLHLAKEKIMQEDCVYIVEGNFDVISMHENGFENCVAVSSSSFSRNHLLMLLKYTNNLFFLLDSDEAGISGAESVYRRFFKYNFNIKFLTLDGYKDIDEYFHSGKSKEDFLKEARDFLPM